MATMADLRRLMFPKEEARRDQGCCPFCDKPVDPKALRDDLSRKEFGISGLCQECRDEMFGGPSPPDWEVQA